MRTTHTLQDAAALPRQRPHQAPSGWRGGLRAATLVLACLLCLSSLAACGSDESEAPAKPTSVTSADLSKDGTFWKTLTPDLKDQLVAMGKDRLAEERPGVAARLRAVPTDKLLTEIEKRYSNQSAQQLKVYKTYVAANDTLALAGFNDAMGQMESLCDSEPRPAQCSDAP